MHIGFDVSQTGSRKAGCGFFAHCLAASLLEAAPQHRYALYPGFGDFFFDPLMPLRGPYRGTDVRYGPRHLTREAAAAFWNAPGLERALDMPQVVHSNNFWCPLQLQAGRLVYTCYDLGFTVDPGWTTETNRVGCFEGMFRAAAVADWIVAISNATRAHFLEVFPHFPQERIRVIYPCSRFAGPSAPAERPHAAARLSGGDFWLSVGTIEPRKNQLLLARAYARYRAAGAPPMPLVFAGGEGWMMEGFRGSLRELGIEEDVILTGYATDAELAWLYGHCFANLYPSVFEGFGLPVLEGLQFGAATLASNTSSIPEAAGDAALLLPADDADAWAEAMARLVREPALRDRLRARGPEHAARFDAGGSAAALLDLYEEAIRMPKRVPVSRAAA